jgi:DNA adenine methylase
MENYSPLRYPGGKAHLFGFLNNLLRINSPIDTYVEPYAGAGGAALALLFHRTVKKVILNDLDDYIYFFWKAILSDTKQFIRKLERTPVSISEWKKQKAVLSKGKASLLDIGFAAFYVNRCNRSGILMAGPIGGQNQTGHWKVDARFNKVMLKERIERISIYRNQIKVFNWDALYFLRNIFPKVCPEQKRTLIYLDPPYYEKGYRLYRHYYKEQDHIALNAFLKRELQAKWVLSYDDAPFIRTLYDGKTKNSISVNHFAYKAKIGKELIIFSDNCIQKKQHKQLNLFME